MQMAVVGSGHRLLSEQGGGCRATFFNYRRKLGTGSAKEPAKGNAKESFFCVTRVSNPSRLVHWGGFSLESPLCGVAEVLSVSFLARERSTVLLSCKLGMSRQDPLFGEQSGPPGPRSCGYRAILLSR